LHFFGMIMVDTGFWLALASKIDNYHHRAKERLIQFDEIFIMTWPVMTETGHLLLRRLGPYAQQKFIENYANGAFQVFSLTSEQASNMAVLMKKYANLPMDLADASLVILAEHLGPGCILSTDLRDFSTYRWRQYEVFENLLIK